MVSNCVEPTGLGSGDSDYYNISQLSNVPIGEIFLQGIVFQNIRFGNPDTEKETAVQLIENIGGPHCQGLTNVTFTPYLENGITR